MKIRSTLALLLLGLSLPAVQAADEASSDAEALDRPLPPVAAPSPDLPSDEASLDAPGLPPPPIDLDYRAPMAGSPEH